MSKSRLGWTAVALWFAIAGLMWFAAPVRAASDTDFVGSWVDGWYLDGFGVNPGGSAQYKMDTSGYSYIFDYKAGKISSLAGKGSSVSNVLGSAGAYIEAVSDGVTYSSQFDWSDSTVKIARSGKYVYDIQIGPLGLKHDDDVLPVTIDWRIVNWADKAYHSVTLTPKSAIPLSRVDVVFTYGSDVFDKYQLAGGSAAALTTDYGGDPADGVALFNDSETGRGSIAHIWSDKSGISRVEVNSVAAGEEVRQVYIPPAGEQAAFDRPVSINFQVAAYNDDTPAAAEADWTAENDPLDASDFTLGDGAVLSGFDKVDGTYEVDIPGNESADYYGKSQNAYDEASIAVNNDATARVIRLKAYKAPIGPGLPCGASVLTDANKEPTGIPMQVSAKWENSGYSDNYYESYTVLPLNASESESYVVRQTWQDWGKHLNVQLASQDLRDYDQWGQVWLSATQGCPGGGSTTDLFVPDRPIQDDMTAANGVPLIGPDYAWKEPNGGAEVLSYVAGGTTHTLKSDGGLRFDKTGPNLTEWTSRLRSDDGKVSATVTERMLPGDDMTRLSYSVHYDFNADMTIANPNANLRLFSLGDMRYGSEGGTPTGIAYKDPATGQPAVVKAVEGTQFPVTGQPLNDTTPYLSFIGRNEGNIGLMVKSYSGTLGGSPIGQLAFTWERANRNAAYVTPNLGGTLNVQSGDHLDMEVILFSYGRDVDSTDPIRAEDDAWGEGFGVTATEGTVLSQWLPNVQLDEDGKAQITLTGGRNDVPLEFSGFAHRTDPRLYERVGGVWTLVDQSVQGKDFYQTEFDPDTGKYNVVYVIKTDGSPREFLALDSSAGDPPADTASANAVDGIVVPSSVSYPRYVHGEDGTMTLTATVQNTGTGDWTAASGVYAAVEAFGVKTTRQLTGLASGASATESFALTVPQHDEGLSVVKVYLQDGSGNLIGNTVRDDVQVFPLQHDFRLVSPAAGADNAGLIPSFTWTKMLGAVSYRLSVYADAALTKPVFETEITAPDYNSFDPAVTTRPGRTLAAGTTYYWTVRGLLADGTAIGPVEGSASFTVAPPASSANLLAGGTEVIYPTGGSAGGSIADGRSDTYRNTQVYSRRGFDYYGVALTNPITIDHVRVVHGRAEDYGGWFSTVNGKPTVQVQVAGGAWVDVGRLDDYPDTKDGDSGALSDGQTFDLRFKPTSVYGVKVVGVPASGKVGDWAYSSVADIQAFDDEASSNLLAGATEIASRTGSASGSIVDGDFGTYRDTADGTLQSEDWFGAELSAPATIDKVRFGHGASGTDGGWFDTSGGKPEIQAQLASDGAWTDIAALADYPATTAADPGNLIDGQIFEQSFPAVTVYGVRVAGKPAAGGNPSQSFASASEVQAFAAPAPFELLSPYGDAAGIAPEPLLKWSASPEAESYEVLVDSDPAFGSPDVDASGVADLQYKVTTPLQAGITYYWKVIAAGADGRAEAGAASFTVSEPIGQTNALAEGTASYSRAGNIDGSYLDGDLDTVRVTWDGTVQSTDWYAVTLDAPQTIDKVRYSYGNSYADGGWFDSSGGKPKIQVQLSSGGGWTDVATLDSYPATDAGSDGGLNPGQSFDAIFTPVQAYGVRVIGTPVQYTGTTYSFSSIAELAAYNDDNLFAGAQTIYSRKGNIDQSFTDGDTGTLRVTYDGTAQTYDWFGIRTPAPLTVDKVVFAHGHAYADGGWFDTTKGKPQIQVQKTAGGPWTTVGYLADYPDTTSTSPGSLTDGETFAATIDPVAVYGLRIYGAPASGSNPGGSFASAAELEGYDDVHSFLQSPQIGAAGIQTKPEFKWQAVAGADSYTLTVADNSGFSSPALNVTGITNTKYQGATALTAGETYYWKVTAVSAGGNTESDTRSFTVAAAAPTNLFAGGDESYSRAGNVSGSIADGDPTTYRVTWDGTYADSDWYAVTRATPVTVNRVAFAYGDSYPDGGWFVGSPQVQVLTAPHGQWITVCSAVSGYPPTASGYDGGLNQGQWFGCSFSDRTAYGIKVVGKPASGTNPSQAFVSLAELQGYDDPQLFPLRSPLADQKGVDAAPEFVWGPSAGATSYTLTVAADPSFASPVLSESGIAGTDYQSSLSLTPGVPYYWKVTAVNASGSVDSQTQMFVVRTGS